MGSDSIPGLGVAQAGIFGEEPSENRPGGPAPEAQDQAAPGLRNLEESAREMLAGWRGRLRAMPEPPPSRLPANAHIDREAASRGGVKYQRVMAEAKAWQEGARKASRWAKVGRWLTGRKPSAAPPKRQPDVHAVRPALVVPGPDEIGREKTAELAFFSIDGVEGLLDGVLNANVLRKGGEVINSFSMVLEGVMSLIGLVPECIAAAHGFQEASHGVQMEKAFAAFLQSYEHLRGQADDLLGHIDDDLQQTQRELDALPPADSPQRRSLLNRLGVLQELRTQVGNAVDEVSEAVKAREVFKILGEELQKSGRGEAWLATAGAAGKFLNLGGAVTTQVASRAHVALATATGALTTVGVLATVALGLGAALSVPFNTYKAMEAFGDARTQSNRKQAARKVRQLFRQAQREFAETAAGQRLQNNYAKLVEHKQRPKSKVAEGLLFTGGVLGGAAMASWGASSLALGASAAVVGILGIVTAGIAVAIALPLIGYAAYKLVSTIKANREITRLQDAVIGKPGPELQKFERASRARTLGRAVAREGVRQLEQKFEAVKARLRGGILTHQELEQYHAAVSKLMSDLKVPAQARDPRLTTIAQNFDDVFERQGRPGLSLEALDRDFLAMKDFLLEQADTAALRRHIAGKRGTGIDLSPHTSPRNASRLETYREALWSEMLNRPDATPRLDEFFADHRLAHDVRGPLTSEALTSEQVGVILDELTAARTKPVGDPADPDLAAQARRTEAGLCNRMQARGAMLRLDALAPAGRKPRQPETIAELQKATRAYLDELQDTLRLFGMSAPEITAFCEAQGRLAARELANDAAPGIGFPLAQIRANVGAKLEELGNRLAAEGEEVRDYQLSQAFNDWVRGGVTPDGIRQDVLAVLTQEIGLPETSLRATLVSAMTPDRALALLNGLFREASALDARLLAADRLVRRDAVFATTIYLDELQRTPEGPEPVTARHLHHYGLSAEDIGACYRARTPDQRAAAVTIIMKALDLV